MTLPECRDPRCALFSPKVEEQKGEASQGWFPRHSDLAMMVGPTSPCWWFCYSYICALSTVWEHILLTNFPNVLVSIVFISFFSCFQDVKSPFWGPQGSVAKLRRSTRITDRPSSTARRFTWRTIAAPGHQFSPNYGYLIGKIMINQGIFGYLIFKHSHIDMILVHWDATPS